MPSYHVSKSIHAFFLLSSVFLQKSEFLFIVISAGYEKNAFFFIFFYIFYLTPWFIGGRLESNTNTKPKKEEKEDYGIADQQIRKEKNPWK